MAGAIADGELSRPEQDQRIPRCAAAPRNCVRFEVAGPGHDAAIRQLLRQSPMPGDISITREREPSYFTGANLAGAEDETVVALQGNTVIGIASCSVRPRYVNGEYRRVGYLGELRLARSAQGRFDVLRRGFQFYAARHERDPADLYFTSIAADNERSRRFLERGLPGMPCYEFLTEFVTLLIRARCGPAPVPRSGHWDSDAIAGLLNRCAREHQFAAHWTAGQLGSLQQCGVSGPSFDAVADGDRLVGFAALWDQRPFRQTVIRSYSRRMRAWRPLLNAIAQARGTVSLPPCDSVLSQAFLSPFACPAGNSDLCLELVERALARAAERGIESLAVGFAEADPRLAPVRRRFRCREYRTRIYRVRWPQFEDPVGPLDGRLVCPEISLL